MADDAPARQINPAGPRRRRRLWELPAESQDWLVALSLPPTLLKSVVERALSRVKRAPVRLQGRESDVLYSVVHDLASRNAVSEAVEQALQTRHAAAVRAAAPLAGGAALRAHWIAALDAGRRAGGAPEIVATAWALLTHADGAEIDQALLYDARALGFAWARAAFRLDLDPARARAAHEAAQAAAVQAERERAEALQQRLAALHTEREAERRAHGEALAALRGEVLRWQQAAQTAQAAQTLLTAPAAAEHPTASPPAGPPLPRALRLARPAADKVPAAAEPIELPEAVEPPALHGRRVLCVGGMPGVRDRYRELVESAGARFAFHDGGLEQSPQRLADQLGAADVVVCQAGCLNHEAYHRVKGHCRRAGKPCLFVERPSLACFARTLGLGPQV